MYYVTSFVSKFHTMERVVVLGIFVRRAEEKDLLRIQRLVAKAGLREKGIEQHVDRFIVVANKDDQLIGTVGVEKYGTDGLLRSLVLDSVMWNEYLSLQFLEVVLQHTKEQQIDTVYLCTKGTNMLFHYLGFQKTNVENVPDHVKKSPHFQQNMKRRSDVWVCSL